MFHSWSDPVCHDNVALVILNSKLPRGHTVILMGLNGNLLQSKMFMLSPCFEIVNLFVTDQLSYCLFYRRSCRYPREGQGGYPGPDG